MEQPAQFKLTLVESRDAYPPIEGREGVAPADLNVAPSEAFEALKATDGASELLEQIPELGNFDQWFSTAYFSVCLKTGTARYLDLWDTDHFDGFTDMQRCVNECRAWFSGDGYTTWGSGATKTGVVNCYFIAPSAGRYICTARLQSYPPNSQAFVECFIDNSTFGLLPVLGTITQPHPCGLSAGGHHFRIRQRSGSFFFLSLTVWGISVAEA